MARSSARLGVSGRQARSAAGFSVALIAITLGAVSIGLGLSGDRAAAQNTQSPSSGASASPAPSVSPTPTPGSSDEPVSKSRVGLAAGALAFGITTILTVVLFIRRERSQSLRLFEDAAAAGRQTKTSETRAFEVQLMEAMDQPSTIVGPDSITIGSSANFVFARFEVGQMQWSLDPGELVDTDPSAPSDTLRLKGKKAGLLKISVQRTGNNDPIATKASAVLPAAEPSKNEIPILGAGWGAVVIALALVSVVGALGFARVLQPETVGTVFGTIAGYVFARGAATSATGSSTGTQTEGSASTTSGRLSS